MATFLLRILRDKDFCNLPLLLLFFNVPRLSLYSFCHFYNIERRSNVSIKDTMLFRFENLLCQRDNAIFIVKRFFLKLILMKENITL